MSKINSVKSTNSEQGCLVDSSPVLNDSLSSMLNEDSCLVHDWVGEAKRDSNRLDKIENRRKEDSSINDQRESHQKNEHPILGTYLSDVDTCHIPTFKDNSQKTIFSKQVNKMGGAWRILKPDYGALGSVGTGSLMEGSYKVIVRGHEASQPKSWEIYNWLPYKVDPLSGNDLYSWRRACLPMKDALKLEGVQKAIQYFSETEK